MLSVEKSLGRLLSKGTGKFDQGRVERLQVQSKHGSLQKFQEEHEIIHKVILANDGMDDKIQEESPEFPEHEKLKNEAVSKIDLYADHNESSAIYKAAPPDSNLTKNGVEERIKKELRAKVVESELVYKESVGKYRTAKECAEDMTRFSRPLSKEEVVGQVMKFAHFRSLPTDETKKRLVDRFEVATEAALRFRDAI